MTRQYLKKHPDSFVGGQKQFYIFKILLDAKEDNNGKNKGLTTEELVLLLLRISGKESTDVAREKVNTRKALHIYKKWGYMKRVKGDKWILDWRNWQNIKFTRKNKNGINRIDWKFQQLWEKAVDERWRINPDYKLEI